MPKHPVSVVVDMATTPSHTHTHTHTVSELGGTMDMRNARAAKDAATCDQREHADGRLG